MGAETPLAGMMAALASGAVRVVDLTQPLSPDTPALELPANFGQCAGFSQREVSRYDERGVAWYWSNFTVGVSSDRVCVRSTTLTSPLAMPAAICDRACADTDIRPSPFPFPQDQALPKKLASATNFLSADADPAGALCGQGRRRG